MLVFWACLPITPKVAFFAKYPLEEAGDILQPN